MHSYTAIASKETNTPGLLGPVLGAAGFHLHLLLKFTRLAQFSHHPHPVDMDMQVSVLDPRAPSFPCSDLPHLCFCRRPQGDVCPGSLTQLPTALCPVVCLSQALPLNHFYRTWDLSTSHFFEDTKCLSGQREDMRTHGVFYYKINGAADPIKLLLAFPYISHQTGDLRLQLWFL